MNMDTLEKLRKEIVRDNETERKMQKPLTIMSIVISSAGAVLLIHYTSWQVGLSMFFLLWGNNIWLKIKKQ